MFTFRQATPDDAEDIAAIVNLTSAGVVTHLFGGLVPGLSAESILSVGFMKGHGPYHTNNVILSGIRGRLTSLLFMYPASEHKVPILMASLMPAKRLKAVRPVLERGVPGSLYINTFWIAEELRGNGHATALMVEAVSRARSLGLDRISLFCWNDNEPALRFYAREGFALVEHLPPETLAIEGHTRGGSILCRHLGNDAAGIGSNSVGS